MSAHVLPPLAVNSKSERKVNSLPPLEFEPVIFRMLAHLSDHSAKSHPRYDTYSTMSTNGWKKVFEFQQDFGFQDVVGLGGHMPKDRSGHCSLLFPFLARTAH
jgi:hypothetical protein